MRRVDRYILRQLLAAFGFFVLIFTGVVWLTQAVRVIDTVVASGQGARVFLEFSALLLPQVFVIVLPLAGIGAALHALNRLYTDSELIVMMGAGLGPAAMLRPVAVFGAMIAAAMAVVLMLLVPRSGAILAERTQAIRSDLANALIVERQFLHPLDGLTLFITDTSGTGEMQGLFLNDQRDPEQVVTYTAERARLVREGMEARLVMFEGVALTQGGGTELTAVQFEQFVFDLSDVIRDQGARVPRPSEYSVPELLRPTPAMLANDRYSFADYVSEAHYKLSLPLARHELSDDRAGDAARRRLPAQRLRPARHRGDRGRGAAAGADVRGPRPGAGAAGALADHVPADAPGRRLRRRPSRPAEPGAARPEGRAGMTLVRYILRGFLRATLAVFLIIALVILLFTSVENLRRFGESGASGGDVVTITLLQAPEALYQVFPLVLMLASLVLFLRFARTSELVVMRASGISALRLISIPVVAAVALGVVFVALVNPFVAATIKRGERFQDEFSGQSSSLLSFSPEGVWLRQADPEGQTVIQAARTNADGTILSRVRMHRFDDEGTLYARIDAPAARLTPGAWVLENAVEWTLDAERPLRADRRGADGSTCRRR